MTNILEKNKIYVENRVGEILIDYIKQNQVSKVFVLVDENTNKYCLDIFKQHHKFSFEVIKIQAGEKFKNIYTCFDIWKSLSDNGADRKSLLINLGGGVVTDIGGFTASCFRRGIRFVHIPTTLLAMVDASIGGKNGVDLENLKNQIGVIRVPDLVLVHYNFLQTLPEIELLSGFAEMIKHGLIYSNSDYLSKCLEIKVFTPKQIIGLIEESIKIKLNIVEQDINETGLRKVLNYGHTLGHAIESYRMNLGKDLQLLHGEAIAIGLVLESFISSRLFGFPESTLDVLKAFVHKHYKKQTFDKTSQERIINLMRFDKKNEGNQINFVLLQDIGKPVLDCKVDNALIYEAFEYYQI